tara:strand:- start:2981 stop:3763 length:783 start_codon:yes stop_codon:yes gene_type:complete
MEHLKRSPNELNPMRNVQKYTTGSLLMMTLSAAAEVWFSNKTNHDFFLSSYELLGTIFPINMAKIESFCTENFPILWGVASTTILQFPLWSIFAISTIYLSYLLLTDTSELDTYGKDFETLQMWSKSDLEDSALFFDKHKINEQGIDEESVQTANTKLALLSHKLFLDDDIASEEDLKNIINSSISEINAEDVEERTSESSQRELRSAYVDPEISELISTTDNETINELANQRTYKDEIDEFDEFSKFLDHTKKTFDEEN